MNRKIKRSWIIIVIIGAWLFLFQGIDLAEATGHEYPTKPITFYTPLAPGGTLDVSVRPLLEAAGKHLGQPFIVINKIGGGGLLCTLTIMNAKPDGYTLGQNTAGHTLIFPNDEKNPYRDLSGFTLICNYSKPLHGLFVRDDAPWKTWKEFLEWAKKNPKGAKIGLTQAKSRHPMGIALWQVEQAEQVEFTYVVMKGGIEVNTAVLGGHLMVSGVSLDLLTIPLLKEKKLRILVYMGKEKALGFENYPSFEEMYGAISAQLMGIWGPKDLPQYVLEKLDDAFAKAVRDPSFLEVMNRLHTPVVYMNRAEINKYITEMLPKVGAVMEKLRAEEAKGIK